MAERRHLTFACLNDVMPEVKVSVQ